MDEDPPYPAISVTLANPNTKKKMKKLIEVDTGFSGTIAVNQQTVDRLQLPVIGEIRVNTATEEGARVELCLAKVSIPELKMRRQPLAALKATKCLIGRKIMDNRKWLLNNVDNELCLLPKEPE